MNKNLSLTRIREIFPQFNKTPITEEDFWRAAKKLKIIVRSIPIEIDGYHERFRGRYYILISNRLCGQKWLHTALHEFCHFLFDVPSGRSNYVLYRRAANDPEDLCERWADAFATICLMPLPNLIELSREEPPEDLDLLRLCMDRLTVKNDYGI